VNKNKNKNKTINYHRWQLRSIPSLQLETPDVAPDVLGCILTPPIDFLLGSDIWATGGHLPVILTTFSLRTRRNCYFWNSDVAIRFINPDLLYTHLRKSVDIYPCLAILLHMRRNCYFELPVKILTPSLLRFGDRDFLLRYGFLAVGWHFPHFGHIFTAHTRKLLFLRFVSKLWHRYSIQQHWYTSCGTIFYIVNREITVNSV